MRTLCVMALVLSACGSKTPECDAGCFVFSPADTGLEGQGANVDQLAVRPATDSRGRLLVFFNGSGGSPQAGIPVLSVARDEGFHAIAVSYRSDDSVGGLCRGDDACFEPTRVSQLTGVLQMGAASGLSDLRADEGIEPRLVAALKHLRSIDADGEWAQFLDADSVRWERCVVSGHSQGGGHAALIAKRHLVSRVLMLASPCDAASEAAPASWLSDSNGWATDASRLFGSWAPGDATCPTAPEIWRRLGMSDTARDESAGCAGKLAHSAPLTCVENQAKWAAVFQGAP